MSEILNYIQIHPEYQPVAGLLLLTFISNVAFFVSRALLVRAILFATRNIANMWAQAFLDKRLLSQASWIIPVVIFHAGLRAIPSLSEKAQNNLENIALILLIILCVRSLTALFGSINRTYASLSVSRNRPIKGFLQILTIIIYAAALILILSIVLNKSPWAFLSGLGAMTAILLLVFRDTLLSFVAGIQLTSNDFIRVGDWIEMPQFGADGDVIDMALNAVTVQNFDKTITVIPTHKFLENSFKNWRGMEVSGGRRIKRAINIDVSSIRFLDEEEIESFKKFKLLRDYLLQKENELKESNSPQDAHLKVNQRRLTNIGTFRAYLVNYLKSHPRVAKEMTLMVRHLDPGPNGLPIEIYIFTSTTDWSEYEGIQADIFDHIFAIAPEFDLHIFQEPTGADFRSLK